MDNGGERDSEFGRDDYEGVMMATAKQEVEAMLNQLPDNCSLEDIQYHLYVLEKIQRGTERASTEGTVNQAEAEERLGKWLTT